MEASYEELARDLVDKLPTQWKDDRTRSDGIYLVKQALQEADRRGRATELELVLNKLGYNRYGDGLLERRELDGEVVTLSHDPFYNLEGALHDLEAQNGDKVVISTVRSIQKRLAEVARYARSVANDYYNSQPNNAKNPRRSGWRIWRR